MIHDPDIGSRLGHKRDHHRWLRFWCDDLDSAYPKGRHQRGGDHWRLVEGRSGRHLGLTRYHSSKPIMTIDAPVIDALKAKVHAADEEFHFALAIYEAWKPPAFDVELHQRLGRSYATNAFLWVREALRREMVLGVLRLWDSDKRNVSMRSIANTLGDKRVVRALADQAADRRRGADLAVVNEVRAAAERELGQRATDAIAIIRKYEEGGSGHATLEKLLRLRNQRLAHRPFRDEPTQVDDEPVTSAHLETLFRDMADVIRLLKGAVEKTSYNPEEAGQIFARHSELFWASVRGERTEGHPSYRPPPIRRPF
jgi:hypothetical protein